MGKNLWLGRYELIRDYPKKISEKCSIDAIVDKKVANEAGKPDKLSLWNFICNPRDNIMIIGWQNPPTIGYENEEYLSFFQQLVQRMWNIFEPIFTRYIPVIPLSEAQRYGLYDVDSLREQFPGPSLGSAPGYSGGSFSKRQIGGGKWFSLILDDDKWNGYWYEETIPEKMTLKDTIREKLAPKYYNPYVLTKGKWREKRNGNAIYKCPTGCQFIPRRFNIPNVIGNEDSTDFVERYKKFIDVILKKLHTQWTLNVWNILSFDYKRSDMGETISIKPEININLGWIETYALGKKKWGEIGEGLHRHHENVYNIRVGLPDNYKIKLKPFINHEKNPVWDGTSEGVAKILEDPYSKLVDLAGMNLNRLILDAMSEFKPSKRPIF
jgi:hypothetical protein